MYSNDVSRTYMFLCGIVVVADVITVSVGGVGITVVFIGAGISIVAGVHCFPSGVLIILTFLLLY